MHFQVALLIAHVLIVIPALLLVAIVLVAFLYGRKLASVLRRRRQDLDKAYAAIDLMLKQRHDELPKLVSTAKSYLAGDSQPLQWISEARTAYTRAGSSVQRIGAATAESEAVRALFKESERYPELKANTSFRQIQKRLGDLDSQIARELARVDDEVMAFNQGLCTFPASVVAGLSRIRPYSRIENKWGEKKGPL